MKVKTGELIGAALDWAVAKCDGFEYTGKGGLNDFRSLRLYDRKDRAVLASVSWSQGGPIIEREKISLGYWGDKHCNTGIWIAHHQKDYKRIPYEGETFLIAAMRCYVASKLGDEVDIPEELLK